MGKGTAPGSRRTQFKPGESGNPGGRPSGRSITKILRERMEYAPTARPKPKTIKEALADALIDEALDGDASHAGLILDRTEGKVKDVLKLEGERTMPNLSDADLAKRLQNRGQQKLPPKKKGRGGRRK